MIANFRKNKKVSHRHNIFSLILIGIALLLIIGFLAVTNLKISQRRAKFVARIEALKKEIAILEQKNKELKEGISQAGSQEYLEKVAREQLDLKAPGEEVVVVTKEKKEEKAVEKEKNFWNPQNWWGWLKSKF